MFLQTAPLEWLCLDLKQTQEKGDSIFEYLTTDSQTLKKKVLGRFLLIELSPFTEK